MIHPSSLNKATRVCDVHLLSGLGLGVGGGESYCRTSLGQVITSRLSVLLLMNTQLSTRPQISGGRIHGVEHSFVVLGIDLRAC